MTNNGDCGETCTNNNGAAECSCETGTLNADGKSCDPGNLRKFTIYSANKFDRNVLALIHHDSCYYCLFIYLRIPLILQI